MFAQFISIILVQFVLAAEVSLVDDRMCFSRCFNNQNFLAWQCDRLQAPGAACFGDRDGFNTCEKVRDFLDTQFPGKYDCQCCDDPEGFEFVASKPCRDGFNEPEVIGGICPLGFHTFEDCAEKCRNDKECRSFDVGAAGGKNRDQDYCCLFKHTSNNLGEFQRPIGATALACYNKIQPPKWTRDIEGISLIGGAHAGAFAAWAMFWVFNERYGLTQKTIFEDKVLGANSGASWIITDMFYDPTVKNSFRVRDEDDFLARHWNRLVTEKASRAGDSSSNADFSFCDAIGVLPGADYFENGCRLLDRRYTHNWGRFMRDLNENYRDKLVEIDMEVYFPTVIMSQSATRMRGFFPAFIMDFYTMNRDNVEVDKGLSIPVWLHFGNEFSGIRGDDIYIPMMEDGHSWSKSRWTRPVGSIPVGFPISTRKININNLKRGIAESGIQDKKQTGGPTSAFFGGFASNHAMTRFLGIDTLGGTERVWYESGEDMPWQVDVAGGVGPLGLADGGYADNTALAVTVFGLQKKGVNTGTILSMARETDLLPLWKNSENQKDESTAKAPGPSAIFKGSFDKKNFKTVHYGPKNTPAHYGYMTVETIANSRFGIHAGSVYKLVIIDSSPPTFLTLPLLLGLNSQQVFRDYGKDILPTLQTIFEDLDDALTVDCSNALCPQDICFDGMPRRQIGDNCCACPTDNRMCFGRCYTHSKFLAWKCESQGPSSLCFGDRKKHNTCGKVQEFLNRHYPGQYNCRCCNGAEQMASHQSAKLLGEADVGNDHLESTLWSIAKMNSSKILLYVFALVGLLSLLHTSLLKRNYSRIEFDVDEEPL